MEEGWLVLIIACGFIGYFIAFYIMLTYIKVVGDYKKPITYTKFGYWLGLTVGLIYNLINIYWK